MRSSCRLDHGRHSRSRHTARKEAGGDELGLSHDDQKQERKQKKRNACYGSMSKKRGQRKEKRSYFEYANSVDRKEGGDIRPVPPPYTPMARLIHLHNGHRAFLFLLSFDQNALG